MLTKRDILGASGATIIVSTLPKKALATETTLTSAAIQSDIALLKRVYTSLHPGLYRYSTHTQIDARFAALSQSFSQPASLSQVYLELSKLLASVRCGHSYANFYSQSEAVQNRLFAGKNRLPFKFVWLNREMVVTDPVGFAGLEKGARMTRINVVATREILATLLPYVRADGHNVGKQMSLLSVNRGEGFQTFDIFYALHFGTSQAFDVTGKAPSGASFALRLPAIDLAARRAMTTPPALEDSAPSWSLNLRDDKIAIMTMPTFGLYNDAWDWRAWLATNFGSLKNAGTTKLIIDLRGNEGGRDDCGPEILSYLTDKPLPPQAGQRRLRYQKIPEDLNPILETWDDSFRDWGDKARLRPDGMYDLLDEAGRSGGSVMPKAPHFAGKVIVLTDATNSSATLQFCQMLRANRLGKIVGGTTGGNLRGINAEKFMFCRLPSTGLEVDVPLVGFFPDGAPPDSGLVPDVAISQTWRDVASGFDRTMDRAMKA
jgi:hypothetical protein